MLKKHIAFRVGCHNIPIGSRQAARGARICETGLSDYCTRYTKAKELAQSHDTDIANVGDMISSKQAIKNAIEGHYKTSWENKMQDTENFPIIRTYQLFNRILHMKATYIN